jgi:hypothetical protein
MSLIIQVRLKISTVGSCFRPHGSQRRRARFAAMDLLQAD